jgi:hypothetical protein
VESSTSVGAWGHAQQERKPLNTMCIKYQVTALGPAQKQTLASAGGAGGNPRRQEWCPCPGTWSALQDLLLISRTWWLAGQTHALQLCVPSSMGCLAGAAQHTLSLRLVRHDVTTIPDRSLLTFSPLHMLLSLSRYAAGWTCCRACHTRGSSGCNS